MQNLIELAFNNWKNILFLFIVLMPFIPARFLGQKLYVYDPRTGEIVGEKKYSMLRALFNLAIDPLFEILALIGLRGTVSIIIFSVIAVDLIFRKSLSKEAVTLVSIGLLALYLEQLVNSAKRIRIGKLLEWEGRN